VGVIVFVVPALEGDGGFVVELGHNSDPAAGLHQFQKPLKLFARLVEMLHGFGAGDEVVGVFKNGEVIGVVQIVNGAVVARLFEHHRKGRAGAAAKVEAARAGVQLFFQGLEKSVQKVPISGIVRIVLMKVVARLFFFREEVLMFWDENQITLRTAQIIACPILEERRCIVRAERAVGGGFLFHHQNGEFSIFSYE